MRRSLLMMLLLFFQLGELHGAEVRAVSNTPEPFVIDGSFVHKRGISFFPLSDVTQENLQINSRADHSRSNTLACIISGTFRTASQTFAFFYKVMPDGTLEEIDVLASSAAWGCWIPPGRTGSPVQGEIVRNPYGPGYISFEGRGIRSDLCPNYFDGNIYAKVPELAFLNPGDEIGYEYVTPQGVKAQVSDHGTIVLNGSGLDGFTSIVIGADPNHRYVIDLSLSGNKIGNTLEGFLEPIPFGSRVEAQVSTLQDESEVWVSIYGCIDHRITPVNLSQWIFGGIPIIAPISDPSIFQINYPFSEWGTINVDGIVPVEVSDKQRGSVIGLEMAHVVLNNGNIDKRPFVIFRVEDGAAEEFNSPYQIPLTACTGPGTPKQLLGVRFACQHTDPISRECQDWSSGQTYLACLTRNDYLLLFLNLHTDFTHLQDGVGVNLGRDWGANGVVKALTINLDSGLRVKQVDMSLDVQSPPTPTPSSTPIVLPTVTPRPSITPTPCRACPQEVSENLSLFAAIAIIGAISALRRFRRLRT